MPVLTINNNKISQNCACCKSKNIRQYAKNINYLSPVFYSTTEIKLLNSVELWKCNDCKSIFIQNAITEEDAKHLYINGKSSKRWNSEERFEDEKTVELNKTILSYIRSKERLLDIGCSTGKLLDFAKNAGVQSCYGIEYSEEAKTVCIDKGYSIINSISNQNRYFDIITAFDLIEHIYDIPSFILDVNKALKLGGYFIVLTGNPASFTAKLLKQNWWYYNYPEHIVFPSKEFYSNIEDFELVEYSNIHNAKSYGGSPLKLFYKLIYYLRLNRKYMGLPAFIKDHHLIVLRKNGR